MEVVRAVRSDDLDQIWELIRQATYGMTTLQINRAQLLERVELSLFAFTRKTEKPSGEPYLFVMEDTSSGQIVGISCIFSKVGGYEPWYHYRIVTSEHHSELLKITRQVTSLHLEKIHDGPTEIGSLFLKPEYRGGGRGRLLSLVRFAYMAQHPLRFGPEVIAEMRGVVHEDGSCPFWDAIGRHFFQMEFPEADSLSTVNKRFIEDLMPKHPIYLCMISEAARKAIGQVHSHTVPALAMLKEEGFATRDLIDIFDGGPVVHSPRTQIDAVARSVSKELVKLDASLTINPEQGIEDVILTSSGSNFRASLAPIRIEGDSVITTPLAAALLQVRLGEKLWILPQRPKKSKPLNQSS